jgi:hypothetical protein
MRYSYASAGKPKRIHHGQGLVEYAIILALVVVVVLLILRLTGLSLNEVYCKVVKGLNASLTCGQPQSYCSDRFNDLSNWTSSSGWQVQNGQLCNNSGSQNFIYNSCSQTASLPKDYTINVDVATLYAGDGYGISFRQTSTNPTNGYIFQYDPGLGMFVFRKWINGAETAPFAKVSAGNYNWYNVPRSVKVEVKGNVFKAYVDGNLVLTGTDDTYTSGGTALRVWDSTKACFDNLSITP